MVEAPSASELSRRTVLKGIAGSSTLIAGSGVASARKTDRVGSRDRDEWTRQEIISEFQRHGNDILENLIDERYLTDSERHDVTSLVDENDVAVFVQPADSSLVTHLEIELGDIKLLRLVEIDRTTALVMKSDVVGFTLSGEQDDVTKDDCYKTDYSYCSTEECAEDDLEDHNVYYQQVCCGGGCSVAQDGCCTD